MKIRLNWQSLPWFALIKISILFIVCSSLVIFLSSMKERTQNEAMVLQDRLQAHQLLSPYVQSLTQREALVKELLKPQPSLAQPKSVREALSFLNQLAVKAGIPDTQFMPQATSVIGRNDIRVAGLARGDSESFRKFVVALSHQSWIHEFEHFSIEAGRKQNTFKVTLRVSYDEVEAKKGGRL